jgi:hypothetical protein
VNVTLHVGAQKNVTHAYTGALAMLQSEWEAMAKTLALDPEWSRCSADAQGR